MALCRSAGQPSGPAEQNDKRNGNGEAELANETHSLRTRIVGCERKSLLQQ